ncbi:hypothetical protein XH88_35715 [Bradyrhizobium sp. CCBAU 51627]|nr:hypothetical protein [Bradyrhizobium sp. CCBAU 51627]
MSYLPYLIAHDRKAVASVRPSSSRNNVKFANGQNRVQWTECAPFLIREQTLLSTALTEFL